MEETLQTIAKNTLKELGVEEHQFADCEQRIRRGIVVAYNKGYDVEAELAATIKETCAEYNYKKYNDLDIKLVEQTYVVSAAFA